MKITCSNLPVYCNYVTSYTTHPVYSLGETIVSVTLLSSNVRERGERFGHDIRGRKKATGIAKRATDAPLETVCKCRNSSFSIFSSTSGFLVLASSLSLSLSLTLPLFSFMYP